MEQKLFWSGQMHFKAAFECMVHVHIDSASEMQGLSILCTHWYHVDVNINDHFHRSWLPKSVHDLRKHIYACKYCNCTPHFSTTHTQHSHWSRVITLDVISERLQNCWEKKHQRGCWQRPPQNPFPEEAPNSDVETAVLGADVSYSDEDDVHNRPHAQPPETEQLADALPPQSKVKSIHTKPSQRYAAQRQK